MVHSFSLSFTSSIFQEASVGENLCRFIVHILLIESQFRLHQKPVGGLWCQITDGFAIQDTWVTKPLQCQLPLGNEAVPDFGSNL